ncbi:hypothetical protein H4217_001631 [Coemansia sp. RSA 1939]|nr:hypothetical protein H4217_001631 [Coemansia sp. RSA 1939]
MKLFDGNRAWFAPNVPASHITAWASEGGVQIRDSSKSTIIQYYFSNSLDDETTNELVRNQDKVLYRSAWIMDSSASRTRQPLGAYALSGTLVSAGSIHGSRRPGFQSPLVNKRRSMLEGGGGSGSGGNDSARLLYRQQYSAGRHSSGSVPRRPRSIAGGDYYHHGSPQQMQSHHHSFQDYASYRDNTSDTQSIVSRSSRHSNASSILSSYGRRQPVSRFAIHVDSQTIGSILADVADFTPNSNGFVAYKIPKLV